MVPFHTNFYQNFHANDFSRERAKRKNNVAKIGWDTVVINFTCYELSEQYQLGIIDWNFSQENVFKVWPGNFAKFGREKLQKSAENVAKMGKNVTKIRTCLS